MEECTIDCKLYLSLQFYAKFFHFFGLQTTGIDLVDQASRLYLFYVILCLINLSSLVLSLIIPVCTPLFKLTPYFNLFLSRYLVKFSPRLVGSEPKTKFSKISCGSSKCWSY